MVYELPTIEFTLDTDDSVSESFRRWREAIIKSNAVVLFRNIHLCCDIETVKMFNELLVLHKSLSPKGQTELEDLLTEEIEIEMNKELQETFMKGSTL